MTNLVKKRIFYMDELRALAILGVILMHTTSTYRPFIYNNLKLGIPGILNALGCIGIPIFFMLSGALLLNRNYTISEFFKKRYTRILLPFIFYIVITLILEYFVLGSNTKQLIKIFFGDDRYTWFVWVIMGIYLFLPVVNSFIKEYGFRGAEYFIGIWLITIILNTFGYYPFHRFELSYFAQFIGYCVLGYYLANKEFKITQKRIILLIVISIVSWIFYYMMTKYNMIANSAYLCLPLVITSIGVFLLFKAISSYSENNSKSSISKIHKKIEMGVIGKIILSISICSYGMYFLNSLLIKFYKLLDIHSLKMLPVLFIGIVFLSWIIVFLLDKIPFLKKFAGT